MIQKISIRLNLFVIILNLLNRLKPHFQYLLHTQGNLKKFVFIALVFTFITNRVDAQEKADQIFNRAYHYLSVDREKGITLLTQCIQLDSTFEEAYLHRGIAYFKQENYDKALNDFEKAYELSPQRSIIWMYKGFAYRNQGNTDMALSCFSNYIAQNPQDTSAYSYILRGKVKYELGDFNGAVKDYDKALNLKPLEEKFQYYRFVALFEAGQYEKAIEAVDRLIALNSDFYGYYFYKGNIYSAQEKYEKAIYMYNIAIIKNYQNADSYFQRAEAYRHLEAYQKALEDYNSAILLKPKDGTFYSGRGNCKYEMGMSLEACEDWNEAGALGYYEDFDKMKQVCNALKDVDKQGNNGQ